jgi:hypothetical protein
MTEAFVPDWTMTDPNEYQFDFGDPSGSGSGYMDLGDMGAQYDFGGGAVFFQHQLDGKSSHASTSRDMSAEDKPPLLYAVKTPIATRRDAAFSLASS